jgi:hypothetical protein
MGLKADKSIRKRLIVELWDRLYSAINLKMEG